MNPLPLIGKRRHSAARPPSIRQETGGEPHPPPDGIRPKTHVGVRRRKSENTGAGKEEEEEEEEEDDDDDDDEDDDDEGMKRPGGPRSRAFFRGASLEGKRHTQRPPAVGVRRGAFLRRGEPEPCRMRYASTGFTEPTKGWGPEKLGTEGIWQTWVFHKPPSQ